MQQNSLNTIKVSDVINSPFAVSTEEGELLFFQIKDHLSKGEKIEIDFDNIYLIVSTFLNASIGQLYGIYSTEYIKEKISILNMAEDDLNILKKVTDRAKEYFNDKDTLENSFKKYFPDAE